MRFRGVATMSIRDLTEQLRRLADELSKQGKYTSEVLCGSAANMLENMAFIMDQQNKTVERLEKTIEEKIIEEKTTDGDSGSK